MTRHTPSATPDAGTHRHTAHLGYSFRLLVTSIVAASLSLTVWTGMQAQAVERRISAVSYAPPHTPIRQIERDVQDRTTDLHRLDEVEGRRFANHVGLASQSGGVTDPTLLQMEHNELRRIRNRAPDWALPALDAEIERLRQALADATPDTRTRS